MSIVLWIIAGIGGLVLNYRFGFPLSGVDLAMMIVIWLSVLFGLVYDLPKDQKTENNQNKNKGKKLTDFFNSL